MKSSISWCPICGLQKNIASVKRDGIFEIRFVVSNSTVGFCAGHASTQAKSEPARVDVPKVFQDAFKDVL